MSNLTPTELNLLLYLECMAVDYGGKIDSRRMNDLDWEILKTWKDEYFVNYGRIYADDIKGGFTHWIILSEPAWIVAHKERRNRHARCFNQRKSQFRGIPED